MSLEIKPPTKDKIVDSESPVLIPKLVQRNPSQGSPTNLAEGSMGSGKTTFLARTCIRLFQSKRMDDSELVQRIAESDGGGRDIPPEVFDNVRREKIFWRGQKSCQWDRIREVEKKIYVQDGVDLSFYAGGESVNILTESFSTVEELYREADPYSLNVVYSRDGKFWVDLINYLVRDLTGPEWNSVFIDELEDIAPLNMPKPYSNYVKQMKNDLKEARKHRVGVYSATQKHTEIDWRCLNKIMYWTFLPGAKPPSDERVWQRAIDSLNIGEGFFTNRSLFERFSFDNYPPQRFLMVDGIPRVWSLEEMAAAEE